MALATYHWEGICSASQDEALFLLANNGEQPIIRVRKLGIRPLSPVADGVNLSAPSPGRWLFRKTTAQSGGVAVPCNKATQATTSLPAQVLIAIYPTVTVGSILAARLPANWGWTNTFGSLGGGPFATGFDVPTGRLWGSVRPRKSQSTAPQRLKLAEGEGFAIVSEGGQAQASWHGTWWASIVFNVGGTATFYASTALTSITPDSATFGIFNGSGSGVTIEIVSIDIMHTGDNGNADNVAFPGVAPVRLYGVPTGGLVETPIVYDTSSPSLPLVELRRGVSWSPMQINGFRMGNKGGVSEDNLGYPGANVALTRNAGRYGRSYPAAFATYGITPTVAGLPATEFNVHRAMHGIDLLRVRAYVQGPTLRNGESLALVLENPSPTSTFIVEAVFTAEPANVFYSSPSALVV